MKKKNLNKSFMNISRQECLDLSSQIKLNAESKYNDGIILGENESYGSGISLLIQSFEEMVKSMILYLDGNGFELRQRITGVESIFQNHKLRYAFGLVLSLINIFATEFKNLIILIRNNPNKINWENPESFFGERYSTDYLIKFLDQINSEITWYMNLGILRQDGMYSDYKGSFNDPLSFSKEDFLETKMRIENFMKFSDIFYSSLQEDDEGFLKDLKAIQKKFIKEGWYDKIGEIVLMFKQPNSFPLKKLAVSVEEIILEFKSSNK